MATTHTYIALLRGINVSGQKKIKMDDLKNLLQQAGFGNVRTYIQSGNVIFESPEISPDKLKEVIESIILDAYRFQVEVIIKTPNDFAEIHHKNPFLEHRDKDPNRIYVTFLAGCPEPFLIEKLTETDCYPEAYVLDGDIIYLFMPNGYGRAKLNNNFFEHKLKIKATTRNWKTVTVLIEMAGSG